MENAKTVHWTAKALWAVHSGTGTHAHSPVNLHISSLAPFLHSWFLCMANSFRVTLIFLSFCRFMVQLVPDNSNKKSFHLCVSYCRYVRSCTSVGARWGRRQSVVQFLRTITCYRQRNHYKNKRIKTKIVKGHTHSCAYSDSEWANVGSNMFLYIYTNLQIFMFAVPHLCCACFANAHQKVVNLLQPVKSYTHH